MIAKIKMEIRDLISMLYSIPYHCRIKNYHSVQVIGQRGSADQFSDMLDWNREQFGLMAYEIGRGWKSSDEYYVFVFYRKADAMAFKLRWL